MTISQRSPVVRLRREKQRRIRQRQQKVHELATAVQELVLASQYALADICRKPGDYGPTPGKIAEMLRAAIAKVARMLPIDP